MIKYLPLLLIAMSCSVFSEPESEYIEIDYPERIQQCVSNFLVQGVGPNDALHICESSFRRKDTK